MLLPPTYRECWLDWQAEEDAMMAANEEKENKPRDQYITKLLKKLKQSEEEQKEVKLCVADAQSKPDGDQDDEVEESWEDLDSDQVRLYNISSFNVDY